MKTEYSLTMRQGGPDQADDECDIEYRAAHEKRTIAENVPDWLALQICALPSLLETCRNAAAAIAIARMPVTGSRVATTEEILATTQEALIAACTLAGGTP